MLILGIETSCDETAFGLVEDGILGGASMASQADVHALFGGVVPELASREHYRVLGPLFDDFMASAGKRLADLDAVAVTRGPGLLGSLLVGVAFAKGLENLPKVTPIPMSALNGDNVVDRSEHTPWYTGPSLLEHLETVQVHS